MVDKPDRFSEHQSLTILKDLELALHHNNAGDFSKAESIYRQILEINPKQPEALHLLGMIAYRAGEDETAIVLIKKALTFKSDYAEAHNDLGLVLENLGRYQEAETSIRQALIIKPNLFVAHNNLGMVLKNLGRLKDAAMSYNEALTLNPGFVEAQYNLGAVLLDLGELNEAVVSYQKTLILKPDLAEAHNNLGNVYKELEKFDEAIISYEMALELNPDYAAAHYNLANILCDLGKLDEAITSYENALNINPHYAEAYYNLGNTFKDLKKVDQAKASYLKSLSIKPDYAEAHNNLGTILHDRGILDKAVTSYKRAVTYNSDYAEAYNNLGNALQELGRLEEAIDFIDKAIAIKPNYPEAYTSLGDAWQELGQMDKALTSYEKALVNNPNLAETYNSIGTTLMYLGQFDEALESYEKALVIRPHYVTAERNLLLLNLYVPGLSPVDLFSQDLRFAGIHTKDISPIAQGFINDPSPTRRLRVGYLSSDFRDHPVGRNVLPLIISHVKAMFEVHCYADVRRPDSITEKIRSSVDHWCSITGKPDEEVAAMVRSDKIDVLVSLAGRFDNNRPLVCAYRAAPVQASFHDGATSGLKELDYWLTDHFLHPQDTKEKFTEELYRLPVFYQYPAIEEAPPVSPPPSELAGFVTFGSFNNPAKVNNEVIKLWSEVLTAVTDSRLFLKYNNWYDQASLRRRVIERFSIYGIKEDQIKFSVEPDTMSKHLGSYSEVDIALDTFPYNGATTTFQALWMGVPVVSLAGDTFCGRMAGSILHHSGLYDLVADTPEMYVTRACDLAKDLPRLEKLRTTLRERIAASSLCDASTYTLTVEAAYRNMWQNWCNKN